MPRRSQPGARRPDAFGIDGARKRKELEAVGSQLVNGHLAGISTIIDFRNSFLSSIRNRFQIPPLTPLEKSSISPYH